MIIIHGFFFKFVIRVRIHICKQTCHPFLLFNVQATVDHSLYSHIIVPPGPHPVIPSLLYRPLVK
uniref:Ovule protein n=1 Tax=Romanomermis culicivorax TaxID=13658 RepID=A0A915ILS7_ROMCU